MPDWEDLSKLWNQIFGNQTAGWLLTIVGTIATLWIVLWFISQIIEIWKKSILPLFYSEEEKRRNIRRKHFAQHLENEINIINSQENWRDYRFTELEAEVEAEGLHSVSGIIPLIKREYKGIKREKSLSIALKTSKARLILLEGDPGSGKSVALRHLTLDLIQQAKKSRNNRELLPVYVNLRGIKRSKNQEINRDLIFHYVLASMNRLNDRDVDTFLEDEFNRGLNEGTWIFLFDSFDEIPDVLSAREVDSVVRKYADAISDFLHGFNQCRGVVASRYFRGPGHVDWPRFNIVGLSNERQVKLIKKANLSPNKDRELIGQLAGARPELQAIAANPLFLEMIIEHVQSGNDFPENTFAIFETYTTKRFEQDSERIKKRFNIKTDNLKKSAQIIAFCMTADGDLGLSPYRKKIKEAVERLNLQSNLVSELDKYLDALEFIKIGRSEIGGIGEQKTFSFSHRRFQEYFATSLVLAEPSRVSVSQLITDPHWRETTVVLCQVWPEEELGNIIAEAGEALYQYAVEIEQWNKSNQESELAESTPMPWPTGLLYLLSLLQDGFSHRQHILPDYVKNNAAVVLEIAQMRGIFPDKKWSLEVAGIAFQPALITAIRSAISHPSNLINSVAYKQLSRLEDIPEDIASWVRKSLLEKASSYRLYRERYTTQAFLSRLPKSSEFLNSLRLLLILPALDTFLHLVFIILLIANSNGLFFASNASISEFVKTFIGSLFFVMIVFMFPLISYLFTYVMVDNTTPIGIATQAFSFLIRMAWAIIGISMINAYSLKILLGIMGYLLLLPIAIVVLLADGKTWKNDLELVFAPVDVFVTAIKMRKSNSLSRQVLMGLLAISAFAGIIGLLSATKVLDKALSSFAGVIALTLCSVPGMLIALVPIAKSYFIRRQNLKVDREKFNEWKKRKIQTITGEDFLEILLGYKTLDHVHLFVETVSKQGILQKGQTSEQAIKQAIQIIEANYEERQRASTIDDMCILLERVQKST